MLTKYLIKNKCHIQVKGDLNKILKGYCISLLLSGSSSYFISEGQVSRLEVIIVWFPTSYYNTVSTKTRHSRPEIGPFKGFNIWYLCIPGQDTQNNKEQLCSTILKYSLWYNTITKLHLHSIYYICLNGSFLFLIIYMLKVDAPQYLFLFYGKNLLLYTFEKLC